MIRTIATMIVRAVGAKFVRPTYSPRTRQPTVRSAVPANMAS
jgi:hypothetical protein